jgi:ABC-type bacteriocin/lantibiotic exporter with double-glycine peptidase domain
MKDSINAGQVIKIITSALKVSLKTKTAASIVITLFGVLSAFFPMLIALSMEQFTNSLFGLGAGQETIVKTLQCFTILSCLYVVQTINKAIQNYNIFQDTMRIQEYMKECLIRITCRADYKYILNYDSFREKLVLFETENGQRTANSMRIIITWIQNLITFITVTVALVRVDIWIVVILLVACIPSIFLSYLQKDEDYRFKTKWMKEGAMVIHYYGMCCAPDSMNDLRQWNIYDYIKNGWRNVANIYIDKKNAITKKHLIYNSIADVFRNSVYIAILLLTFNKIYNDITLGLGIYMLVLSLSSTFQNVATNLFVQAATFSQNIKYMRDFFEILKFDHIYKEAEGSDITTWNIEVKNIFFRYPNSNTDTIKGININIKEGERIAIVGNNGSGKSTFINMICGLLMPDTGSIEYGGQNLKDHLSYIKNNISVAFQDFSKYAASIKDNIIISDDEFNEALFFRVCKETGVNKFAERRPNGYDEIIGPFSEDGNNLSGGEWQSIALARAAYRMRAKIMILDEPTAALDPMAEANLYEAFTRIMGKRTVILVSHRLGICRLVDRILVMEDGRIIEQGTHNQLMQDNTHYKNMYLAQAQWYN